MTLFETRPCSAIARRSLLLGTAAFVALPLTGCGGGGGGSGGDGDGRGGGGGVTAPTGSLVYRNSGVAAVYNFGTKTELQFNPLTAPFVKVGMSVSANKVVTSAVDGDGRTYFDVGMFGLDGKYINTLRLRRELATQTGAAVFNASGSRLALSLNEVTSTTNKNRISRVVVVDWPSGQVAATIDGYEEPIWLGTGGELLVRTADDRRMFVLGADLRTLTRLGNLVSSAQDGAYSATPDGRYIAYQNAVSESSIFAYDRNTGASWVAATVALSGIRAPVISPEGRFMAVHSRLFLATVPHVVNFGVNVTVAVDNQYALSNTLAESSGRMGWVA
jgi:hypothetical protein